MDVPTAITPLPNGLTQTWCALTRCYSTCDCTNVEYAQFRVGVARPLVCPAGFETGVKCAGTLQKPIFAPYNFSNIDVRCVNSSMIFDDPTIFPIYTPETFTGVEVIYAVLMAVAGFLILMLVVDGLSTMFCREREPPRWTARGLSRRWSERQTTRASAMAGTESFQAAERDDERRTLAQI